MPTEKHSTLRPKEGIRIRNFRAADSTQVRDLFLLAMGTGPGSPRVVALNATLFHPLSYLAYALIGTGLVLFARSAQRRVLGALMSLSTASLFLGYRHMFSNSFLEYCYTSLDADLADIATHYKMQPLDPGSEELVPSGPGGFWVVETELPDGKGHEIIGCVGLDYSLTDGKERAELRRMVVSPHHRRRGVGTILIETLIAHARTHKLPSIYLGTTTFQGGAMQMYEKFGWLEESRTFVREKVTTVVVLHYRLDLTYA